MLRHSADENHNVQKDSPQEDNAVLAALKLSIQYSNEAQALVDKEGKLLYKNKLCHLAESTKQITLPPSPIAPNSIFQYKELMIRALVINEQLVLLKPLAKASPSIESDNWNSHDDLKALNSALFDCEKLKRNQLLVLVQIHYKTSMPNNIIGTIAQLLGSCWRSGDKIYYLNNATFAILYNNSPDIALVKSRLGSIDNILCYKGFKGVKLHIGHCNLQEANMNSTKMFEQARKKLKL